MTMDHSILFFLGYCYRLPFVPEAQNHVIPPFQNASRFGFFRYIAFTLYLRHSIYIGA